VSKSRTDSAAPRARRRFPRLPWTAVAITVLLAIGAIFSVPPVRDAVTLQPVAEVELTFSPSYLLLAPLWDVLDALTLLTVPQHIALLLSLLIVLAIVRVIANRRRRNAGAPPRPLGRAILGEAAVVAGFLVVFFGIYGIGVLIPRPMAELLRKEQMIIAVDVHAHTRHSHDGRSGWTAEDVRQWYQAAGFDAVYIADHRTFDGVIEGQGNNPIQVGQRTTILPALELVYNGEHVNILSAGRKYAGLTTPDLRDMDTTALTLASAIPNAEPVLVQTFPGDFHEITPAHGPGTPGVRAIELIDGAPRGLRQTRSNRERIVHLADSLNLALVSGSNNHGWGRTAPGWTLFRIVGWQLMTPADLADNIEAAIRRGGRNSTRVIERVGTETEGATLGITLPALVWRIATTLTTPQRISWLAWTWAIALLALVLRRRRAPAAA